MRPRVESLTKTQVECLRAKWDGLTDTEIAQRRGTSKRMVEAHLSEARRRLGANRSDIAAKIVAEALGWPPSVKHSVRETELSPTPDFPAARRSDLDQAAEGSVLRDVGWTFESPVQRASLWPVRSKGARRNDLSIAARTLWILAIAIGIPALLVLALMSSDYLGRLVADMIRLGVR